MADDWEMSTLVMALPCYGTLKIGGFIIIIIPVFLKLYMGHFVFCPMDHRSP